MFLFSCGSGDGTGEDKTGEGGSATEITDPDKELQPFMGAGGKIGYRLSADTSKVVIPATYEEGLPFSEGLAGIQMNGKGGFINAKGEMIVPAEYEKLGIFMNGKAWVKKGLWGIIDASNKVIVEFLYDDWQEIFGSNYYKVRKGQLFGLLDKDGKTVIAPEYEQLWEHGTEMLVAINGNNQGLLDLTGKLVVPIEYAYINEFQEGFAVVEKDGKKGFIDKTGAVVIPIRYENAFPFTESLAKVQKGKLYGYIDAKGDMIINYMYEQAAPFAGGKAEVSKGGKFFKIDKTGKCVEGC